MTYEQLEAAVRAWVLSSSGLDDAHVYFRDEEGVASAPRPSVVISLGGAVPRGIDALTHTFDPKAKRGQEITIATLGWRELQASLEAFGTRTTEPDDDGGEATARQVLANVCDSLFLPGIRGTLNRAGLGVKDAGSVVWHPGIQNAKWEGRAALVTTFFLLSTVTEKTGYIARVKVGGRVSVPVDADPNVKVDVQQ